MTLVAGVPVGGLIETKTSQIREAMEWAVNGMGTILELNKQNLAALI